MNCTSEESPWQTANKYVWMIGGPLVLLVGVPGNIVTLVVLHKMHANSASHAFFKALAVADLSVILTTGLIKYIQYQWGLCVQLLSRLACRPFFYLALSTNRTSVTMLTILTIHRALVTVKGSSVDSICTLKAARALIATVFVTIYGYYLYLPFVVVLKAHTCTFTDAWMKTTHLTMMRLDFVFFVVIPYTTMMVSNYFLIRKVYQTRHLNKNREVNVVVSRLSHMTHTAVVASVTFVALTLPMNALLVYSTQHPQVKHNVYFTFLWGLGFLLVIANSAVNFLIYIWTGPHFRLQLKLFFLRNLPVEPLGIAATEETTRSLSAKPGPTVSYPYEDGDMYSSSTVF